MGSCDRARKIDGGRIMCGRYTLTSSNKTLNSVFGFDFLEPHRPRYNIGPQQDAPIVFRESKKIVASSTIMRWGLVPAWTGDLKAKGHINARCETLSEKPSFKDSFAKRRALVPADGFIEWGKESRKKQPYHIRFGDNRVFAFAGIWDEHIDADGQLCKTFAIVTTGASDNLKDLHHRMPVIVNAEHYQGWLSGRANYDEIFAAEGNQELVYSPVNPKINNIGEDGPQCLEPYEPPQMNLGFL